MSNKSENRFLFSFTHESEKIDVYEYKSEQDNEWNTFIENTKLGQYEQTDYWSRLKKHEGWSCIRIIYKKDNTIIGGYQLLYKSILPVAKTGYITHGPVFDDEVLVRHKSFVTSLEYCCKNNNIIFILIQQPDDSILVPDVENSSKFIKNNIIILVKANIEIDLTQSMEKIISKIKRDKIQKINKARKLNLTVWNGGKEDLPLFFSLMKESCERQNVTPQPDSLEYLRKMWDLLSKNDLIKLYFIDLDGENVSSCLNLQFNKKVYMWKFGWSGKYPSSGINDYFYFQNIEWAKESGFHYLIDMGIDPNADNTPPAIKSASYRKLRFGGEINKFPDSYLYVPNPLLSLVLKAYPAYKNFKKRMMHR